MKHGKNVNFQNLFRLKLASDWFGFETRGVRLNGMVRGAMSKLDLLLNILVDFAVASHQSICSSSQKMKMLEDPTRAANPATLEDKWV